MAFEDDWNSTYEGLPADNENINLGAGRIRDLKANIRERANVDHSWGDTLDNGRHNQVTFNVSANDPVASSTNGIAYTKTVGGNPELFYTTPAGHPVQLTSAGAAGAITGEVRMWTTTTAPTGWLICNGQAVSRTTYAGLFALIASTFGAGDGSTTFNVPDARGNVIAGYDPGNATERLAMQTTQGVSASGLGNAGGEQSHTLIIGEIPAHNHAVTDNGHSHTVSDPGHVHSITDTTHSHNIGVTLEPAFGTGGTGGAVSTGSTTTSANLTGITGTNSATIGITGTNGAVTGVTTQNTGGSTFHNNVQPTLILNFIIKT